MVAAAQTASGQRFSSAHSSRNAVSIDSRGVPRRQPTPSTSAFGAKHSPPSCRRTSTRTSQSAPSVRATPTGHSPSTGHSERTRTVSPAKILAETALMPWGSVTAQFWCFAHSSTANSPLASVAVVMTATAPQMAAISLARSLPPPRWPETTGTAKRPHSSTATTAGSRALLFRNGATARTAMPTAPTNTSASKAPKASAVHWGREKPSIRRVHDAVPPKAARSCSAKAAPRSVKDR